MEEWRLLDVEIPANAAMNLAIEEAIFLGKMKRTIPPTLRFWRNRCAVIIGYSQNVEAEINLSLCESKGIQIVRRFTGGGAVYHDLGNLNYSIAVEVDYPLVKGMDIIDTYRLFSSGIIEGLREFGVNAVFDPPSDLIIGSRKISGNAQSRKKGVIFHHGTLLVNADLDLLTRLLDVPKEEQGHMKLTSKKRAVANLEDELGYHVGIDAVKEALRLGFERAFSAKLVPGALVTEEQKTAEQLFVEKYSQRRWNFWR